jgi:hypothetical protein
MYFGCLTLALYLGREFIGWMWWENWEDDDDEPFPAPLLVGSRPFWSAFQNMFAWILRQTHDVCRLLRSALARFWPEGAPRGEPMDADGRTPTEWLLINVVGVWNLRSWYGGEYDWEVRQRWEECLEGRKGAEETAAAPERKTAG